MSDGPVRRFGFESRCIHNVKKPKANLPADMETLFKRIADREYRYALMDFLFLKYHLTPRDVPALEGRLLGDPWSPARALSLADTVMSLVSPEGVPAASRTAAAIVLYEPTGVAQELASWDDIYLFHWDHSTNPSPGLPGHISIYSLVLRLGMSAGRGAWRRASFRMDFHEDDWVYVTLQFSGRVTPYTSWPPARLMRFLSGVKHPKDHLTTMRYRCDGESGVAGLVGHIQRQSKEFLP
jgi:hypothetical protein